MSLHPTVQGLPSWTATGGHWSQLNELYTVASDLQGDTELFQWISPVLAITESI